MAMKRNNSRPVIVCTEHLCGGDTDQPAPPGHEGQDKTMTATINYTTKYGNFTLADGRIVTLTQQAWRDNNASGEAAWFANGYLGDDEDESVVVQWESLGTDTGDDSDDADWTLPVSIKHYALGELL
jgi:hypothetical protein